MLEQIEYSGTVWALSHNDPEPLIEHTVKKLQEYGVKKDDIKIVDAPDHPEVCLLYTSPSPRDRTRSRMPSSA